jgi:hypothetical protein
MVENQGTRPKIPTTDQASKALAKDARDWVASPEGRKEIEAALAQAKGVTSEVNKSQLEAVESLRVTFNI